MMGWNKNTIVDSTVTELMAQLDASGVPYTNTCIGIVKGIGLNDSRVDGEGIYELVQIVYLDKQGTVKTIRQRMDRNHDCDADDFIVDLDLTGLSQETIDATPIDIIYHDENFCRAVDHAQCPPFELGRPHMSWQKGDLR